MLKANIPHIRNILQEIPPQDRPENEVEFWEKLAWELSQLIKYAATAEEPEIVLAPFRKAAEQYISEFWVNDLALPKQEQYNWHLQNTSQWKYAGAIVLQHGSVSTHH